MSKPKKRLPCVRVREKTRMLSKPLSLASADEEAAFQRVKARSALDAAVTACAVAGIFHDAGKELDETYAFLARINEHRGHGLDSLIQKFRGVRAVGLCHTGSAQ